MPFGREKQPVRTVSQLPGIGRLVRIGVPGVPPLPLDELVLFDLPAVRTTVRTSWVRFFLSLGRNRTSTGRLIVTTKRLLYLTYRDARTMFLLAVPREVGATEIVMSEVESISHRSWRQRAWWGISVLPGITMVEIHRRGGQEYRFAGVPRLAWDGAMQQLIQHHPHIRLSEAGSASGTDA